MRPWSTWEKTEFCRIVSSVGIEYIRKERRYNWTKFRNLSQLQKGPKDKDLTEYFRAFLSMCKRECGTRLSERENNQIVDLGVDILPEEKASRVLERIDLLNRLRNDVMNNCELPYALELALPSKDLPEWWIPAKHDLDLLKGVAKYGFDRSEYYILPDPAFSFHEILRRHTAGEPLITKKEKEDFDKRFNQDGDKGERKNSANVDDTDFIPMENAVEEENSKYVTSGDPVKKESRVKRELTESDKKGNSALKCISLKKENIEVVPLQLPLVDEQEMDEYMANLLLTQLVPNPFKWPKDRDLQTRIEHIMHAVKYNKWPVAITFPSASNSFKSDIPPLTSPLAMWNGLELMESTRKCQLESEILEKMFTALEIHSDHDLSTPYDSTNASVAAFEHDDKKQSGDSQAHRELDGTLDSTVKPVNFPQINEIPGYSPRRCLSNSPLNKSVMNSADKYNHRGSTNKAAIREFVEATSRFDEQAMPKRLRKNKSESVCQHTELLNFYLKR